MGPVEVRYAHVSLDAKREKVRDGGRVIDTAVVLAHGVHETAAGRSVYRAPSPNTPRERRRRL